MKDRCHRIGQTKAVTVYKLFAEDSVDEDIYEMGERKRQLSKAVLADERKSSRNCNTTGKTGRGKGSKNRNDCTGDNNNGTADVEEEEDDTHAISNILQKALLKRVKMLALLDNNNNNNGSSH